MPNLPDQRQYAPATQRNREAILAVLTAVLPTTGQVLEISSGTGEHAVFFAQHFPQLSWQPSDISPVALASIEAWRTHTLAETELPNLHPPLSLNVCDVPWPVETEPLATQLGSIRAIVNINMIHISPWSSCLGLFAGAARILPEGYPLYLYGPFKQQGQHTAPSNEAFDTSLRSQNSEWGVRDLEAVQEIAANHQFVVQQVQPMPANNLSVVFIKQNG
ncbi:MAG: DUF938 domain-containing protein [Cyanobacteria bacterium P01_H01_bin.121]